MTDDFGYLNARIHVRRSQLLHEGFFREALKLSFAELVKILGESIYGPDLAGDTLADIDHAVTLHLNRTVADLPHLVAGEAQESLSLLLMRTDLANVRTILQGKKAGWSNEEIMGHLGTGTLPQALYKILLDSADAASLSQVFSLPKHPLAKALREASSAARELSEMEMILDRTFYQAIMRRARELDQPYLADFMVFEIDAQNLATGLKLFTIGFKDPTEPFFLKGGRHVGLPLFLRLAEGDLAALEQLGGTDFDQVAEVKELLELERGLRCILLAKAGECSKDVLGAGLAIDYIQRKQWEAGRIRLLARRAYFDLPSRSIEQELFCE